MSRYVAALSPDEDEVRERHDSERRLEDRLGCGCIIASHGRVGGGGDTPRLVRSWLGAAERPGGGDFGRRLGWTGGLGENGDDSEEKGEGSAKPRHRTRQPLAGRLRKEKRSGGGSERRKQGEDKWSDNGRYSWIGVSSP